MTYRTIRLFGVGCVLIGLAISTEVAQASEAPIRPGDKVVTTADAAVQVGARTLATVPSNTELIVTAVKDQWVAVTIQQDGKDVSGWVDRKHLSSRGQAADQPAAKPPADEAGRDKKSVLDQSKPTFQGRQNDHSIRVLAAALEQYRRDVGDYPTNEEGLGALLQRPVSHLASKKWKGPYLNGPVSSGYERRDFVLLFKGTIALFFLGNGPLFGGAIAPEEKGWNRVEEPFWPECWEQKRAGYLLRGVRDGARHIVTVPLTQFGEVPKGTFVGPAPAVGIPAGATITKMPTSKGLMLMVANDGGWLTEWWELDSR